MSTELSFCHFHRFWSRNYRNYIAGNVIAQRLFADSCFAGPWRVLEYLNNCIGTVVFIGYQVFYFLASTMSLPLTELLLPSFHILLFPAHSRHYIQTLSCSTIPLCIARWMLRLLLCNIWTVIIKGSPLVSKPRKITEWKQWSNTVKILRNRRCYCRMS